VARLDQGAATHGNGRTDEHGQKTRLPTDITDEILMFFQVLTQRGLWPGGIHLELTSHDVIECVSDASELGRELPSYQSACDPRLNPEQVASVADLVGELLADASTDEARGRLTCGHRCRLYRLPHGRRHRE
jgi:3-deoxy-7-phosphoheptulonate synthase